MTLIIYDPRENRVYADRNRHDVGSDKVSETNKLVVMDPKKPLPNFKEPNQRRAEEVLMMSGSGNVANIQHAQWLVEHKAFSPHDVAEHFNAFRAGNTQGVRSSRLVIFSTRYIWTVSLRTGNVVRQVYGEQRHYWGSMAEQARIFDKLFDLPAAKTIGLCSRATDKRISETFTVVTGLPNPNDGMAHDIQLHATAPWPDDLQDLDMSTFYANPSYSEIE